MNEKTALKTDTALITGMVNKAMVFGWRFMSDGAQARMNEKMYEEVDPEDRKLERGDIEAKEKARS